MLHIITGGVDADQQRDGDFLGHDERYLRTDEYLQVMRQVWTAQGPFDFEGKYYQVRRGSSEVVAAQSPHVPLWFGGVSEAAKPIGAKHCDTYALFGESLGLVRDLMHELDGLAAGHDRTLRYNLSFRPIIADTEDAAWKKARQILHNVETTTKKSTKEPEAETAKRLSRLIDDGEVHDERLWVPIAAAAQGTGNSTALVGTPEQVAEAIAKYYDLGGSRGADSRF